MNLTPFFKQWGQENYMEHVMDKKEFGKLFLTAVFILFVLFTLSGNSAADGTIRLGVVGAHSGDLASYGISGLRGATLAVKEINAKGGILNRQVEIFTEDDECQPRIAAGKANKMVIRKVHAVVGHICSGATQAALEVYKDTKIIVISPSATNPYLTMSREHPNFYRTIAHDDAQAKVEVDFAQNVLKLKRIAVLHDKGVYGKGLAVLVKELLEKSSRTKLVWYEGIAPGSVNYSTLVRKIQRSNADGVIYGGYHPTAAKIVMHMRKKKMKTLFISGDGIKDDTFVQAARQYADGVYATAPRDTSKNPLTLLAVKSHKQEYGTDPGPFFLNAWAAVLALANAMESAGSTEYTSVSNALKTQSVETPIGTIRFDEHGDAVGVGFSVYQVKEGRFVELKQ